MLYITRSEPRHACGAESAFPVHSDDRKRWLRGKEGMRGAGREMRKTGARGDGRGSIVFLLTATYTRGPLGCVEGYEKSCS